MYNSYLYSASYYTYRKKRRGDYRMHAWVDVCGFGFVALYYYGWIQPKSIPCTLLPLLVILQGSYKLKDEGGEFCTRTMDRISFIPFIHYPPWLFFTPTQTHPLLVLDITLRATIHSTYHPEACSNTCKGRSRIYPENRHEPFPSPSTRTLPSKVAHSFPISFTLFISHLCFYYSTLYISSVRRITS